MLSVSGEGWGEVLLELFFELAGEEGNDDIVPPGEGIVRGSGEPFLDCLRRV